MIVSLVGPLTNFALAALMGFLFVLTTPQVIRQIVYSGGYYPPTLLGQVIFLAGIANIVLGVFNLIPCPPLDGASVLERFIPARWPMLSPTRACTSKSIPVSITASTAGTVPPTTSRVPRSLAVVIR